MDFYRPPVLQGALDALGSVNRALRAWKFYPQGHPTRKTSIKQAHVAMLLLLDGNNLSLNSGRTDFSFPDGESFKDATRMSSSLSYELFIRRVRKITFLKDLLQDDLLDFLRLLTTPTDVVQKAGGMDKLMSDHGIRTIWVNEFDLSIINGRRLNVESTGNIPLGLDEIESSQGLEDGVALEELVVFEDALNPVKQLQLLLGRLIAAVDEDAYKLVLRQAIVCSEDLKARNEQKELFPLVELLADHASEPDRGKSLCECARYGLEQLAADDDFLLFLLDCLDQVDALSHEAVLAILRNGGSKAVDLILKKMGSTDNLSVRKTLSTMLVCLGKHVVPAILKNMDDNRWYIVRNLSAVLGDIGACEAVPDLQKCLRHSDIRVCKESVRSLAKIGGADAEAAIIEVLRGIDSSLFPQVIASLGGMKSRKALVELMHIVCGYDFLLKQLPLKIEALAAIAMIGDRQVVPVLAELLSSGHIIVPSRWKQFNISIAGCLARLGDSRALPVLKKKASDPGELGRACAEAVETIERGGEQHGVA
jgi:HEAT repeat protein